LLTKNAHEEVILLSRKFIQEKVGINKGWRAGFAKQGEKGVTTFNVISYYPLIGIMN
jgi:hypothetical protein